MQTFDWQKFIRTEFLKVLKHHLDCSKLAEVLNRLLNENQYHPRVFAYSGKGLWSGTWKSLYNDIAFHWTVPNPDPFEDDVPNSLEPNSLKQLKKLIKTHEEGLKEFNVYVSHPQSNNVQLHNPTIEGIRGMFRYPL